MLKEYLRVLFEQWKERADIEAAKQIRNTSHSGLLVTERLPRIGSGLHFPPGNYLQTQSCESADQLDILRLGGASQLTMQQETQISAF